jgi:hypothetical protein
MDSVMYVYTDFPIAFDHKHTALTHRDRPENTRAAVFDPA